MKQLTVEQIEKDTEHIMFLFGFMIGSFFITTITVTLALVFNLHPA